MVRRFNDDSHRPTRALQAWLILISYARNRQTLTYTQLDEIMQFGNPQALGQILYYIYDYCGVNQLPVLSSIVVSKTDGKPSNPSGDADFAKIQTVFDFDWYAIFPPSPEELKAALKPR